MKGKSCRAADLFEHATRFSTASLLCELAAAAVRSLAEAAVD
ncbi:MAG: hypothetical protein ABR529_11945 [Actinomycetota bacterium]